jgi:hypothetical protein
MIEPEPAYLGIEARDGINREILSEVRPFTIE